jgi:hypothetical protein
LDSERHFFSLFQPAGLKWCCSPQSGVKSQVAFIAFGRTGLNVTAAFEVCMGAGSPAPMLPDHLIQWGIQPAGLKGFAGLYLLSAFPPAGISIIEYTLNGARFACLFGFIPLFFLYRLFF